MTLAYQPMKKRHVSKSEHTNSLLKRKRILEFSTSTAEEWFDLANDFLADDCRANHAYCMMEFRKRGGEIAPVAFVYEPAEPEVPEYVDYTDY